MESSGRKRKFNYPSYNRQTNRSTPKNSLVPGLRGFLCTCNFREKDCIRESYNLLNEYADCDEELQKVVPQSGITEATGGDDCDDGDIQDTLTKELESLKSDKNTAPHARRFQVVDSGVKNCLFIRTTLPNPVNLVHNILKDVEATKKQKSRFLIRMLPVETTCKAYMEDIKKSADILFEKYFTAEGKKFSIVYNCRYNHDMSREKVIDELAKQISGKHPENRVDLKQPELAVLVEIIRNICCISVLPDYYKFRKYNLLEVSGATEAKNSQNPAGGGDNVASNEGEANEGEPVPEDDVEMSSHEQSEHLQQKPESDDQN